MFWGGTIAIIIFRNYNLSTQWCYFFKKTILLKSPNDPLLFSILGLQNNLHLKNLKHALINDDLGFFFSKGRLISYDPV